MKDKVLKENIVFNIIKTLITSLSPMLIFMYVTRVISVVGLGKVTFAKNLGSYFCLFASLGISYYGTREGAKVANNKVEFNRLFWEIAMVNVTTTIASIVIYVIFIFNNDSLKEYGILLFFNIFAIALSGLSSEWVLAANEKYKEISIRTIVTQIICVAIMLLFIHDEDDYFVYAILLLLSGYGSTVFNLIYIFKNKIVGKPQISIGRIKKHLKPIIVLFAMLLSIDLYTLLDTTMLGIIKGDRAVGLYTAAIKVPRLVNSLIGSVGAVLVPKLSYFYEKDRELFYSLTNKAMRFVFMFTIPCAIGVYFLSDEILLLVCGEEYLIAEITLKILSVIILIIPVSVLFNNQIFIPMRKEKYVLKSTCIGALVNIIFNSIFIPLFAENGAALGTVLAEFTVMCVCIWHVKKELQISGMLKLYLRSCLIASSIIPVILLVSLFELHYIIKLGVTIGLSMMIFLVISWKDIKDLL